MEMWEDLNKQARKLENEIDQKLVSFSRLGDGSLSVCRSPSDTYPNLPSEHVFESQSLEIEQLLMNLNSVDDKLCEIASSGVDLEPAALLTLKRHREILSDYMHDHRKTVQNFKARRERENLLHSVRDDINAYKSACGINRRVELYAKENEHIRSSEKLIDDQINIAIETREQLFTQRLNLKLIQARMNDLSSRFPAINSLVHRINIRKRRDSIIIACILSLCTLFLIQYNLR